MRRISFAPIFLGAVVIACSATTAVSDPVPAAPSAEVPPAEEKPPQLSLEACQLARKARWTVSEAPSCQSPRTCVDPRGRFWVEGKPFIPRGLYNGGWEYTKLLANCPEGAECRGWNPSDVNAFVKMLADAGFNLIQERSRYNKPLLDAVHAEPRMKFAHLLWSDPFTQKGHDDMVSDIQAAAADPSVVMWFGPDEIDHNDDYPTAAGIRRILRGSRADTDKLVQDYPAPAGNGAFLPKDEPAADPMSLPFGAALAYERGLAVGSRFYELLMPITYPIKKATSNMNESDWGTWRTGVAVQQKHAALPVLQMVGIPEMGLAQPSAAQIRALLGSAIANGAFGGFYYTLIRDMPKLAGRDGWFAADDRGGWAAFSEMHALEDSLIPVFFSNATEEAKAGERVKVEWRTWKLESGDRVTVLVNPRATATTVDLAELVGLADGEEIRTWQTCDPVDPSVRFALEPYAVAVLETAPAVR
jgi:hypothetical protein